MRAEMPGYRDDGDCWNYTGTVCDRGTTNTTGTLPRILWVCSALKTPSSEHDRT